MKKRIAVLLWASALTLAVSCNRVAPGSEGGEEVTVEEVLFEKASGTDCDQPDSQQTSCLHIALSLPKLATGSEALQKNISEWTTRFFAGLLAMESDESVLASMSLEKAAQQFIASHDEFLSEAEDSPVGNWTAESSYAVLLNDGRYLTLQIEGYVFSGGAHGNPAAAVATFDVQTGRQLTWDDLTTDPVALKTLAEKIFRVERADAFAEGFEFDDIFEFDLPANYGLVENGLYLYYVPYEVGPYVLGITEFTIPFSELGALAKIKL